MANKRNKKYTPQRDQIDANLRRLSKLMNDNNFAMIDTFNLLLAYQHVFYVQGMQRISLDSKNKIKFLNSVKNAMERVISKIESQCVEHDGTLYAKAANDPVKIHKLTRLRIIYFCNMALLIKRPSDVTINRNLIGYAKQTMDISLLARKSNILKFIK